MKNKEKIERLVKEAAPIFEAEEQRFSWQIEEYNEKFSAVVSIEKDRGNFVRFRSFSVLNCHPAPSRYQRRDAFVVCHPKLTAMHLFKLYNINNMFRLYDDDMQFLREFVEAQRDSRAVFRSIRGDVGDSYKRS
ncbi:hypothetical protein HGG71_05955 [Rhodobacteraceae bacterium R_SAG2]|nr:hypothetical protein [Rhodobacteraceae bacterium R_SAG2]